MNNTQDCPLATCIHTCLCTWSCTHMYRLREKEGQRERSQKTKGRQTKTKQIKTNKNTKQKNNNKQKTMASLSGDLWRLVPGLHSPAPSVPGAPLTCTLCVAGHREGWGPQSIRDSCDGGRVRLSWPKIWHRHARPTGSLVSPLSAHFHLKGIITPRRAGPGKNDPVAPRGADTGEVADSSGHWVKKTRGVISMSHSSKMVVLPSSPGLAHSPPLLIFSCPQTTKVLPDYKPLQCLGLCITECIKFQPHDIMEFVVHSHFSL